MSEFSGTAKQHANEIHKAGGHQAEPVAVTASADGSTSIIPKGAGWVKVTSANSGHIVKLPSGMIDEDIGMLIEGYVGSNGFALETEASSDQTINGTDADGTNSAAIPATTIFKARYVAADTWILEAVDEGGDDIAGITPA